MPFAGLDLHKKMIEAVVLEDDGSIRLRQRFRAVRAAITEFARQHLVGVAVALKATFHTWPAAACCSPRYRSSSGPARRIGSWPTRCCPRPGERSPCPSRSHGQGPSSALLAGRSRG